MVHVYISDYDYVSRTFAPKCSVAEDSVCGSGL